MHATTPIPDARRSDPTRHREEVASLLRVIREGCPGPKGERPTMQQVADLIGLSDSALYAYSKEGAYHGRRGQPRAVPYPVVYALRVLVAGLPAARAAIWGTHGAE